MQIIDGIDELRCAIVKQACRDYFDSLVGKRRLERRYKFEMKKIEKINKKGKKVEYAEMVATPVKWGGVRRR